MFRDNGSITPQEAVTNAVAETVRPWTELKQAPPPVQVIEVARITGFSPYTVAAMVHDESLGLNLIDQAGFSVNGNLRQAAIDSTPGKLLGRLTGGKRSHNELAYELGIPRLQIQPLP